MFFIAGPFSILNQPTIAPLTRPKREGVIFTNQVRVGSPESNKKPGIPGSQISHKAFNISNPKKNRELHKIMTKMYLETWG